MSIRIWLPLQNWLITIHLLRYLLSHATHHTQPIKNGMIKAASATPSIFN